MKTQSNGLLAFFALAMMFVLAIMASSAAFGQNDHKLHIKGDFIESETATVLVLEFNDDSDTWVRSQVYENVSDYEITLESSKDYQIWFTCEKESKMMCVLQANDLEIDYYYELDIDFGNDDCCIIYRDPLMANDRYFIEIIKCKNAKKSCSL